VVVVDLLRPQRAVVVHGQDVPTVDLVGRRGARVRVS
jgi:hypothetical protein